MNCISWSGLCFVTRFSARLLCDTNHSFLQETSYGCRVGDQRSRCRVSTIKLEWLDEENSCRWNLKERVRLCGDQVIIVTFDLPILLKTVDICHKANLPMISRLGGFHLLKSYLASVGDIMDDSGLQELIQLSTTTNHILNGGCFDKAIRVHLLIHAAILSYYKHGAVQTIGLYCIGLY